MKTAIDKLSKSIKLPNFRKVEVVLEGFIEQWPDFQRFIQASERSVVQKVVRALEDVVRFGKHARTLDIAMEILVRLARTEKEALSVVLKYLCLNDERDDVVLCYFAVDNLEKHFSPVEVEAIPLEILRSLIEHGPQRVMSRALSILKKAARQDPRQVEEKVPKQLLFEQYSDKETRHRERQEILEIADVYDSAREATGYIDLDTLFLINWVRKRDNISLTEMDELFDSLQRKYLSGPHVYAYAFTLMVTSREPDVLSMALGGSERERDHEVHQFDVGALGLFLLEMNVSSSKTLKDYISDLLRWKPEEVVKAWLVAAFLHDHALPIVKMLKQALPIYAKKRRRKMAVDARNNDFKRVKRICSEDINGILDRLLKGRRDVHDDLYSLICDELKKAGRKKEIERKYVLNHGVMAAANLATTLRNGLRRSWNEIPDGDVLKASVRAIAVHDITSQKVGLKTEPIAFLLVLCDAIQEWGREMTLETPSIRIGRFEHQEGKLFFKDVFEAIFDYRSAQSRGVDFDDEKFKEGLKSTEKRFSRALSKLGIKPRKIRLRPQL